MLQDSGFTDVVIGEAVDTFGGAQGEDKARAFAVYGYASWHAARPATAAGELTVPWPSRIVPMPSIRGVHHCRQTAL
jgi:hypothetical protein